MGELPKIPSKGMAKGAKLGQGVGSLKGGLELPYKLSPKILQTHKIEQKMALLLMQKF